MTLPVVLISNSEIIDVGLVDFQICLLLTNDAAGIIQNEITFLDVSCCKNAITYMQCTEALTYKSETYIIDKLNKPIIYVYITSSNYCQECASTRPIGLNICK